MSLLLFLSSLLGLGKHWDPVNPCWPVSSGPLRAAGHPWGTWEGGDCLGPFSPQPWACPQPPAGLAFAPRPWL